MNHLSDETAHDNVLNLPKQVMKADAHHATGLVLRKFLWKMLAIPSLVTIVKKPKQNWMVKNE